MENKVDKNKELPGVPREDSPPSYEQASSPNDLAPDLTDHEELGIDFAELDVSGPQAHSLARVATDGTIDLWLDVKKALPDLPMPPPPPQRRPTHTPALESVDCPPLNIVIFVVGSRGDVQPYVALAIRLIQSNGHRVRLATHGAFKDLVLNANARLGKSAKFGDLTGRLEFFDVGGDPKELMAFMVKNPGLMPGFESLTNGDISSKRRMVGFMLKGFYNSCCDPDQVTEKPFAADVIISNPPAFAHIHVAEALGLPLIISFTMPWSPTQRFSHPLVNVQSSNAGDSMTNYLSYALADTLMWQGLGDIVNKFRTNIGIRPLSALTGPMSTERLRVPVIYGWSPSLLPKPEEWRDNIDVVGFLTMPTTVSYTPDAALVEFLKAGPPPIYIGFGSIVVKDPDTLTNTILDAVKESGTRALLSAGWSDLGGIDIPDSVYLIKGDIPHDWLFDGGRVSAVCHHGGAGTTSAGLRAGLPTVIIPFFGDQQFWGTAVALAGAGPHPIPHKKLKADKLTAAFKFALSEPARAAAASIGAAIRAEDGTKAGVDSVHARLPLEIMRCDVDPSRVAQWYCKKFCLRLSNPAAGVLTDRQVLSWGDLKPLRAMEYDTGKVYLEPITAISESLLSTMTTGMIGTAQLFTKRPEKGLNKLTWGIVKGGGEVVGAMHQGFENLPNMMGTRVRPHNRVDGVSSGLMEGGRGLAYGWMDAVTGLVTEPMDGYKRSGIGGAMTGVGTGLGNLFFRPMAASLGVLVYPSVGAYKSIQAWMSKGGPLMEPRKAAAVEAEEQMSTDDSGRLVLQFREVTKPELVKARREAQRQRNKELAAAAAFNDLSPEELKKMSQRSWWKEALPPPRPQSESGSRSRTHSRSPSFSSPGPMSPNSEAPNSDVQTLSSSMASTHLTPPLLPPRKSTDRI